MRQLLIEEVLGYRAIVREQMGQLKEARDDLRGLLDVTGADEPGRYRPHRRGRQLCEDVLRGAWAHHHKTGAPDLEHLHATAESILTAEYPR